MNNQLLFDARFMKDSGVVLKYLREHNIKHTEDAFFIMLKTLFPRKYKKFIPWTKGSTIVANGTYHSCGLEIGKRYTIHSSDALGNVTVDELCSGGNSYGWCLSSMFDWNSLRKAK